MKFLVTRKSIISEFAKELAKLQQEADRYYYIRKDKNHSSWLLDQAQEISSFASKLGISKQVYEEAYKIYDFRNSGKKGYDLINGKITLIAGDYDLESNTPYQKSNDNRYLGYHNI